MHLVLDLVPYLIKMNIYKLEEEKYFVIIGMNAYGGSFVQALSIALTHADSINVMKIKETWPNYWKEYLAVGKKLK